MTGTEEELSELRQFFRVRFSKQGDIRFTSHHDLMRLFERALRRAGLPTAMSQGFNPRPRISLPAPLSVGIEGHNEVFDFELREWVQPEEARQRLERELPEGIRIRAVRVLPPKPDRQPTRLSYRIPLLEGHPVTEDAVRNLLAADRIVVERSGGKKARTRNIAEFIRDLRLEDDTLRLLLEVTAGGTARPEEVLGALGCEPGRHYLRGAIERDHVSLSSSL